MHGGNGPAMSGDPDEAHEALFSCLDRCFQRPAWPQGQVPVTWMNQGMQLNEVHRIDPQAIERPMHLIAGVLVESLSWSSWQGRNPGGRRAIQGAMRNSASP